MERETSKPTSLLSIAIHAFIPATGIRAPSLAILALLHAESIQLLLARGDHAQNLVVAT
jgi:hypothetical protein